MSANGPRGRAPGLVPVGTFLGVPVYFAPSWLVIAVLLTAYYTPVVHNATGSSTGGAASIAAAFAVLFALCVLAHELGHTAVSLALHRPVRRIVIFLLGGVSELDSEPDRPRDDFLIAAAGPLVSALLAAVAGAVGHVLGRSSLPGALCSLLLWSNLLVAVFNVLPGLPLDGGRLIRAAVWRISGSRVTGTAIGAWAGRALAVALVGYALVMAHESWGLVNGAVSILVAVYLWIGAGQAQRSATVADQLPAVRLEQLLRPGLLVPSDVSVAEALRRVWEGAARGVVLTDAADRPSAIVDERRITAVPPEQRPWTPVTAVARPLESGLVLPVSLSGEELVDAVRATPANEYLVVNPDGSPAGILAVADLVARLSS